MKKEKTTGKLFLVLWMLLTVGLFFSACGSGDDRPLGIDGYVYVADELSLPQENVSDCRACGSYLYYLAPFQYDSLYRFNLDGEEGSASELVVRSSSDRRILCYTVDDDMSVYYYQGNMQTMGDSGMKMTKGELVKCGADGTQLFRRTFDIGTGDTADGTLVSLAADGSGRTFLLAGDTIYVTDMSGEEAGSVSVQEYRPGISGQVEKLLEGEGGRVYYYMRDGYKPDAAVYEILGDGAGFRLERLTAFNAEAGVDIGGSAYGSPAGLLYNNNGLLRLYRQEGEPSWNDLLRWTDSDLIGSPREVVWISEERLAATYYIWEEGRQKLYLLTKKSAGELPEREELVLASISLSSDMDQWVMEFNQSSEQYHITVELFTRSEADMARLDAMLVSSNPPDILDMTFMNVMKYANKHLLEDLFPYLEKTGKLGKEGYLDNCVDGYTVDGRLIGIPKYFYMSVIMGRKSQVGDDAGWTMKDLYALSKKHPENKLVSMDNFEYALEELCADYILEAFIDWEKGECYFDGDEFRELMGWLDEHTSRVDRIFVEGDYWSGVVPEDMLLLNEYIYRASDILQYQSYFGSDITIIGYPTVDSRVYYRGIPSMLLGITSGSRHKEGAGQFLEFFLTKNSEVGFPVCKEDLARLLENEMVPEYLPDANGEPWLDGNGEPVPRAKGGYVVDGELIEYYVMTKEQVDEIWSIISAADFTPDGGTRDEVIGIIMEEMRNYLYKEKSLEEVTAIIQNRVRTLVQESM